MEGQAPSCQTELTFLEVSPETAAREPVASARYAARASTSVDVEEVALSAEPFEAARAVASQVQPVGKGLQPFLFSLFAVAHHRTTVIRMALFFSLVLPHDKVF